MFYDIHTTLATTEILRTLYRLEDDRPALNRVRTQSRLPIYFWSWRGVVHSAPTPAGVRGAKAGLPRAEMRSRRSRDLISARDTPALAPRTPAGVGAE